MSNINMKCPKCGASGEQLSWWIKGDFSNPKDPKIWVWECFECEHEWETNSEGKVIKC